MTTDKKEKIRNEKIIDQIIERIKNGGASCWRRGWDCLPVQSIKGRKYTYENSLSLLGLQAVGKSVPIFLTYKQAQNYKGLKKGSRGACIRQSWFTIDIVDGSDGAAVLSDEWDDTDDIEKTFHKKYNTVFSVSDVVDPLPEWAAMAKKYAYSTLEEEEKAIGAAAVLGKIKLVFDVLRALPIDVKIGGYNPAAVPTANGYIITVPHLQNFNGSKADFISSILHELTHALKRQVKRPPVGLFWSREAEEMTAEVGALFLANRLNLPYTLNNSLEYIQSWFNRSCCRSELAAAIVKAQESTDWIINKLVAAGVVAGDNN